MKKRAQITIFIIIGIVIVAMFLFAYLIYSSINRMPSADETVSDEFQIDIDTIRADIDACIESTSEEAFYVIGQQGGYYKKPLRQLYEDELGWLPYYYFEDKKLLTEKQRIEQEIEEYIEDFLPQCINLTEFDYYTINKGNPTVDVKIGSKVIVNVDYPFEVSLQDVTKKLQSFSLSLDIGLEKIYNAIVEILDSLDSLDSEYICTSCLTDIGNKYDLYFRVLRQDDDSVILSIRDENSNIYDEYYTFMIAIK